MRKQIPIIALVFLLTLPSLASAVYLDSVTGTADCEGWNTDVQITFRSGARLVYLDYMVALWDASGLEMERFEYGFSVGFDCGEAAGESGGFVLSKACLGPPPSFLHPTGLGK